MTNGMLSILLIEDDDVAAESLQRNLRKQGVDFPVVWAEDGIIALEILRGEHPSKQLTPPSLILLDLNLPRMNGLEFIGELRADRDLSRNVVFVLTTSDAACDRHRAYQGHVAGYMVKSAVGPQFAKLARLIAAYGNSVVLP